MTETIQAHSANRPAIEDLSCPVCGGAVSLLDSVDFNTSCEEVNGFLLPRAGVRIEYFLCAECGYCYAPALFDWTREEFAARIYNDGYRQVDPDGREARPKLNAKNLNDAFGSSAGRIRHLDFGGGNGLLAETLRESGWDSTSYDPFVDAEPRTNELGSFDLVTAYEVFEHVPHPRRLLSELSGLVAEGGVILFTTLLSDGFLKQGKPLEWWYAAPRNGHISLFSSTSLGFLGATEGFEFGSFHADLHVFFRTVPAWAQHVFPR